MTEEVAQGLPVSEDPSHVRNLASFTGLLGAFKGLLMTIPCLSFPELHKNIIYLRTTTATKIDASGAALLLALNCKY